MLNTGTFADLEGPLCCLIPFKNGTDSELETYDRCKSEKIKLILQLYDALVASILDGILEDGLDLDLSA